MRGKRVNRVKRVESKEEAEMNKMWNKDKYAVVGSDMGYIMSQKDTQ